MGRQCCPALPQFLFPEECLTIFSILTLIMILSNPFPTFPWKFVLQYSFSFSFFWLPEKGDSKHRIPLNSWVGSRLLVSVGGSPNWQTAPATAQRSCHGTDSCPCSLQVASRRPEEVILACPSPNHWGGSRVHVPDGTRWLPHPSLAPVFGGGVIFFCALHKFCCARFPNAPPQGFAMDR